MRSINLGRWSRRVERYFNIKGGGGLVDVDQSIRVVLPIASGVEERYLEGWNRFAIASGITGAAGNSAGVELHNPIGTGVIGVVERIATRGTAASQFTVSLTAGPALIADFGVVQATRVDGRTVQNSTLVYSTSTAAVGFANSIMFGTTSANLTYANYIMTVDQEIVLLPGSAIIVVDGTVAEGAAFELQWRERVLEQSELT